MSNYGWKTYPSKNRKAWSEPQILGGVGGRIPLDVCSHKIGKLSSVWLIVQPFLCISQLAKDFQNDVIYMKKGTKCY